MNEAKLGARLSMSAIDAPVESLEGENGFLKTIRFVNAEPLACTALFFCSECTQRSTLPERLSPDRDERVQDE